MAEDSALVFIAPDDSVEAIVQKIRGTGNGSIELLVPDGTPALQALGGFARLRQSLERDHISLLVISSDEKTLNAARLNQLDTVGVQGARVPPPPTGNGSSADRYSTQVLPRESLAEEDAEFLDALDQLPPQDRYAGEEDADLYAALDDLSDTLQTGTTSAHGSRSADDEFASALDEWSMGDAGGRTTDEWGIDLDPSREQTAPRRRVRPEDLELSADDLRRQPGARRTTSQRARSSGRAESRTESRSTSRRSRSTTRWEDLDDYAEAAPRGVRLGLLLPLVIVLLALAIAAFWYLRNRTTIDVTLPGATTTEHPFIGEVIPIASSADKSPAAVQAIPVEANAEFTVQGQVTEETLSPTGAAKGTVTIINRIAQEIQLPAETQLVALKEDSQEVRFKLEQPVTVPAATTTNSLTGSSTTFGSVEAPVVALAPGAASNIGENAITQILIPGQPAIASETSNFVLRNAPIVGGEDQPQRIVTEADVARTLPQALTSLNSAGIQALQGQLDSQQAIDPVSISPSAEALGDPQNYELVVEPPVGQPVDPNNPVFNLTVRARFSALATPSNQLVGDQLRTALQQHLIQQGNLPCKAGEAAGLDLTDYRWDGNEQRLTADALITCRPSQTLAPEIASQVKRAVAGKSRAEASQNLDLLRQEGLIESYLLPNREQFPSFDFLLTVQQSESAPSDQPQPTTTP
jgi:hypothetical protein